MKKIFSVIMLLILSVSVISCSDSSNKDSDNKVALDNSEKVFSAAMVTDTGGIDDKSFNQGTWEGIQKFVKEVEGKSVYAQSNTDADYIPNLSTFADDENYDIIIAPGFFITSAMEEVSKNYPDQKFLILDTVVYNRDNVMSAVFSEQEGSYLLGQIAAKATKDAGKNAVGFIGGADFEVIQRFEAGFVKGVRDYDKNIEIFDEFVGDFSDTGKAQSIASKMYDKGAYVIYHAAGGAGNGLIKEAKDRKTNGENVWVMGVDRDQYEEGIYDGDKSVIMTSMVKKVDVASYDVCKMVKENRFEPRGIMEFGIKNNGVGLPDKNPNLTEDLLELAETAKEKIISGEVKVSPIPERLQDK